MIANMESKLNLNEFSRITKTGKKILKSGTIYLIWNGDITNVEDTKAARI